VPIKKNRTTVSKNFNFEDYAEPKLRITFENRVSTINTLPPIKSCFRLSLFSTLYSTSASYIFSVYSESIP
jgi:hypothetical protein